VNFLAGAPAGGFLARFIALLGSPPGWIENYQRGAWGEQRTTAVLAPLLDEGWTVIHDLPRTKSNLDHVLIGPGGVFVLDTKSFRGTTEARRDTLAITCAPGRVPDYKSDKLARSARAQGAELNQILRLRGQARVWVSAAAVLWTDFPQQRAEGDRMTYLHGDQLIAWLREQPARLNARQIDQLAGLPRPGQRRRTESSEPTDVGPPTSRPPHTRHEDEQDRAGRSHLVHRVQFRGSSLGRVTQRVGSRRER
jgi:hypothetical protein